MTRSLWSSLRSHTLAAAVGSFGLQGTLSGSALFDALKRLLGSGAAPDDELSALTACLIGGSTEVASARDVLAGLSPLLRVAPSAAGRRISAAALFDVIDADAAGSITTATMASYVERCLAVAELRKVQNSPSSARVSSETRAARSLKIAASVARRAERISKNEFIAWSARLMRSDDRVPAVAPRSPSLTQLAVDDVAPQCAMEAFFVAWLHDVDSAADALDEVLHLEKSTASSSLPAMLTLAALPQTAETWAVSFSDTPFTTAAGEPVFFTAVMRIAEAPRCVVACTLRAAAMGATVPCDEVVLEALSYAMSAPRSDAGAARRPALVHVAHRLQESLPALDRLLDVLSVSTIAEPMADARNAALASGTNPDGLNFGTSAKTSAALENTNEEEWTVACLTVGAKNPATNREIVLIGVVVTRVPRDSALGGCVLAFALCDAGDETQAAATACLRTAIARPMPGAGPPRKPDRICVSHELHSGFFALKKAALEVGVSARLTRSTVASEQLAPVCASWAATYKSAAEAEQAKAAMRLQAIQRRRVAKREREQRLQHQQHVHSIKQEQEQGLRREHAVAARQEELARQRFKAEQRERAFQLEEEQKQVQIAAREAAVAHQPQEVAHQHVGDARRTRSDEQASVAADAAQARATTRLEEIQEATVLRAQPTAAQAYSVRVNRHGSVIMQPRELPSCSTSFLDPQEALSTVATFFDDVSLSALAQQLNDPASSAKGMVSVGDFVRAMRLVAHVHERRSDARVRQESCTTAALQLGAIELFKAMSGVDATPETLLPLRVVIGSMAMVRLNLFCQPVQATQ